MATPHVRVPVARGRVHGTAPDESACLQPRHRIARVAGRRPSYSSTKETCVWDATSNARVCVRCFYVVHAFARGGTSRVPPSHASCTTCPAALFAWTHPRLSRAARRSTSSHVRIRARHPHVQHARPRHVKRRSKAPRTSHECIRPRIRRIQGVASKGDGRVRDVAKPRVRRAKRTSTRQEARFADVRTKGERGRVAGRTRTAESRGDRCRLGRIRRSTCFGTCWRARGALGCSCCTWRCQRRMEDQRRSTCGSGHERILDAISEHRRAGRRNRSCGHAHGMHEIHLLRVRDACDETKARKTRRWKAHGA